MWKDTYSAKLKGHGGQNILTLIAGGTIKSEAKDKMCDFFFENNGLDLIAHEFLCHHLATNHLLSATAAVLEKLLQ